MKKTTIVFDCNKQFNVLAFFSAVDEKYQHQLHGKCGFDEKMINQQLISPASKFNPNFATDPIHLLEMLYPRIEKYLANPAIWNDDKAELNVHFEKSYFPEGIGVDAIYPLDKIPGNERSGIHIIRQKSYRKRVYYTREKTPTWQVNIVLENRKAPSIIIIHPGKPAPPFPDMLNMGCKEFMESAIFWRGHVIMANPD
jgi:hypothetical protein